MSTDCTVFRCDCGDSLVEYRWFLCLQAVRQSNGMNLQIGCYSVPAKKVLLSCSLSTMPCSILEHITEGATMMEGPPQFSVPTALSLPDHSLLPIVFFSNGETVLPYHSHHLRNFLSRLFLWHSSYYVDTVSKCTSRCPVHISALLSSSVFESRLFIFIVFHYMF